jgi:hypothetical protein
MSTDMDLFELLLFDVIILLIFACFMITAIFFTGNNLFLILLSLIFGLFTVPHSRTIGGWWSLLKSQEREKFKIKTDENRKSTRWIIGDFGLKGNAWIFRSMSLITAVFAAYNLIKYIVG